MDDIHDDDDDDGVAATAAIDDANTGKKASVYQFWGESTEYKKRIAANASGDA